MDKFGEIVKRQREIRGWSQGDMCERLEAEGIHWSFTYISHIENGKNLPSAENVIAIADLFALNRYDLWIIAKAEKVDWYSHKLDREYKKKLYKFFSSQ